MASRYCTCNNTRLPNNINEHREKVQKNLLPSEVFSKQNALGFTLTSRQKEIAFSLGFDDPHFSKLFKNETGQSFTGI